MADGDFDLDRSMAEAWDQFGERLGEVISVIADGELTIGTMSSSSDPAPFVRFSVDEDNPDLVVGEASSNAVLGDGFQLDLDQLEQLESLGWTPPSAEEEPVSPNFVVVKPQEDSQALADLAVATLRDVFGVQHPVFLAPDQLAEVLQGEAAVEALEPGGIASTVHLPQNDTEPEHLRVEAVKPRDQRHLEQLVARELTELFGHAPIQDSEGDFAIRVGSTMVFVRITPDAEEVVLFSALVHDVEGRSRAVEVLNDLNVEARHGRFALHRDRVFVTQSVLAQPFVPAHLERALKLISAVADGIDDDLAAKLRGRTTFDEPE